MITVETQERALLATIVEGGVRLEVGKNHGWLHPSWLRDRSQEPGQIEETNRQRLFTPADITADIAVTACQSELGVLAVTFSDGHTANLDLQALRRALGWAQPSLDEPPLPKAWTSPLDPFPYIDWAYIGWDVKNEQAEAVLEFLTAFFRHGYVVLRNASTEPGTVARIAERLGYLVGTNFGPVFDVRVEEQPTDLAFTSIELLAHTDLPYRQPVPGIQMLHCLINEAPGGDSTLVDGLAAASALYETSPAMHAAMVNTELDFRYDTGADTVVNRGYILDYDPNGRFRQIRFNTKIDEPILQPGLDLDAFYDGRRWLTQWLNDKAHQVTFRLEPGDVMFMDNHRVLHGRTEFDPSKGSRHLQGCYIEHDGPDTMYRLASRSQMASRYRLASQRNSLDS